MKMKNKKSIKIRILKSTLILVSIILLGIFIAFNILVNHYINNNANKQLELADEAVENYKYEELEEFKVGKKGVYSSEEKPPYEDGGQGDLDSSDGFKKYTRHLIKAVEEKSYAKGMIINSKYELVFPTSEEYYIYDIGYLEEIVREIEKDNKKLEERNFEQISTEDGDYYSSILKLDKSYNNEEYYIVLFVDIREQLELAENINILLFIVMCVASMLTIITTIFLSEKISRPIKKISGFAKQIGNGDFTELDMEFEDKELDELLRVMNKSANYLHESDKAQKTFFQNISHELRTPLMSMVGYAEAIKYNVMDKEKACNIILEEGDKLKEMIEELLYISRLDNITKDYHVLNCDLREVLSSCIESKQASAINKNIKLICDFDEKSVMYMCDEKSLSRAFLNIIENGLRYAKTEIVTSCKLDKDKIIISIENDGPNINKEDMPYIFDRFYKGEKGKSGIGLAIVKSIIEKHNGNIYCENTLVGVKFVIEFIEKSN